MKYKTKCQGRVSGRWKSPRGKVFNFMEEYSPLSENYIIAKIRMKNFSAVLMWQPIQVSSLWNEHEKTSKWISIDNSSL